MSIKSVTCLNIGQVLGYVDPKLTSTEFERQLSQDFANGKKTGSVSKTFSYVAFPNYMADMYGRIHRGEVPSSELNKLTPTINQFYERKTELAECLNVGQTLGYVDPKLTPMEFEKLLSQDFARGKVTGSVSKTFLYQAFPNYMKNMYGRISRGEVSSDHLAQLTPTIHQFYQLVECLNEGQALGYVDPKLTPMEFEKLLSQDFARGKVTGSVSKTFLYQAFLNYMKNMYGRISRGEVSSDHLAQLTPAIHQFYQLVECLNEGQTLGYVDPKLTPMEFEKLLSQDFARGKVTGSVSKTFLYQAFPNYMKNMYGRIHRGEVPSSELNKLTPTINQFYERKTELAECLNVGQALGYVDPKLTPMEFEKLLSQDFARGKVTGSVSKTFLYQAFPNYIKNMYGRISRGEVSSDHLAQLTPTIHQFYIASMDRMINTSPTLKACTGWGPIKREGIVHCYLQAQALGLLDPKVTLETYTTTLRGGNKPADQFHSEVLKLRTALESGNIAAARSIAPIHSAKLMDRMINTSPTLKACTGWGPIKRVYQLVECLNEGQALGYVDPKLTPMEFEKLLSQDFARGKVTGSVPKTFLYQAFPNYIKNMYGRISRGEVSSDHLAQLTPTIHQFYIASMDRMINTSPTLKACTGWGPIKREGIVHCYLQAQALGLLDPKVTLETYTTTLRGGNKPADQFHSEVLKLRTALESGNIVAARSIAPIHSAKLAEKMLSYEQGLEQYWIHRDYKGAIKKLNEVLAFHPYHPTALFTRGMCHLLLGNAEAASSDYKTVFKEQISLGIEAVTSSDSSLDPVIDEKQSRSCSLASFFGSLLFDYSMNTIHNKNKAAMDAACNSHPFMQKLCQCIENSMPASVKKKHALVLTASEDHNGAFDYSKGLNSIKSVMYNKLNRIYDVEYKTVFDLTTFCDAIDKETAENGPIDLLVVRAHGNPNGITLSGSADLTVQDEFPSDSCLQNLPSDATVLLSSCSTGSGRENVYNFANFVLQNSPANIRIFSPTEAQNFARIVKDDPIEFEFFVLGDLPPELSVKGDVTYKIDASNEDKARSAMPPISNLPATLIPSADLWFEAAQSASPSSSPVTQSSALRTGADIFAPDTLKQVRDTVLQRSANAMSLYLEAREYAVSILKGGVRGLMGLVDMVAHPLDNVVYPISDLVYDATVIAAGDESLIDTSFPFDDLAMMRHTVARNPQMLKDAVKRMHQRGEGIKKTATDFMKASGPQKAEALSALATTVLAPGYILKAAKALNNYRCFGTVSKPPKFYTEDIGPPKVPLAFSTLKEIRNELGLKPYIYIIMPDRELRIIKHPHFSMPVKMTAEELEAFKGFLIDDGIAYGLWGKAKLAEICHAELSLSEPVIAAGQILVKDGKIWKIDPSSGHFCPYGEHLEKLIVKVFIENGWEEAAGKFSNPFPIKDLKKKPDAIAVVSELAPGVALAALQALRKKEALAARLQEAKEAIAARDKAHQVVRQKAEQAAQTALANAVIAAAKAKAEVIAAAKAKAEKKARKNAQRAEAVAGLQASSARAWAAGDAHIARMAQLHATCAANSAARAKAHAVSFKQNHDKFSKQIADAGKAVAAQHKTICQMQLNQFKKEVAAERAGGGSSGGGGSFSSGSRTPSSGGSGQSSGSGTLVPRRSDCVPRNCVPGTRLAWDINRGNYVDPVWVCPGAKFPDGTYYPDGVHYIPLNLNKCDGK